MCEVVHIISILLRHYSGRVHVGRSGSTLEGDLAIFVDQADVALGELAAESGGNFSARVPALKEECRQHHLLRAPILYEHLVTLPEAWLSQHGASEPVKCSEAFWPIFSHVIGWRACTASVSSSELVWLLGRCLKLGTDEDVPRDERNYQSSVVDLGWWEISWGLHFAQRIVSPSSNG